MRCSYCHHQGHNKTTCEVKTEYLRSKAQSDIASSYWKSRYEERIAPRTNSSKSCGYCQHPGHTRRTCERLIEDQNWYVQYHNEMVGVVHNYLINSPIGIGSLFSVVVQKWIDGEYKKTSSSYLLIGFEMPANVMTTNIQPLAILQSLSGKPRLLKKPIRRFVRGQDDPGYHDRATLTSACACALSTDWATSKMISFEDTKSVSFFKRVGRKREDHRSHLFHDNSNAKRTIENGEKWEQDWRYEHALKRVEEWKPTSIYAKMMRDYKNV
jgi:hypothetical protein